MLCSIKPQTSEKQFLAFITFNSQKNLPFWRKALRSATSSDRQHHPHARGKCYERLATGKGGMERCKYEETQVILKNEQRSGERMLLPRMKEPCWKCGSASVIISRESKMFLNKRIQVKSHTDNTHGHTSLPRCWLFWFLDTNEPLKVFKVNLLHSCAALFWWSQL